ncbi:hypothetical protein J23TS9_54070 [Paenibacillus sp. J23TS9]|nr:hypothetical protein J23TS9_54070 [Paenibacillus sp. J23TS9]
MPVYNKLVRDRIPDIIAAQGKQYTIKTLNQEEYIVELRKKLQEEHQEYITAGQDREAVEELADNNGGNLRSGVRPWSHGARAESGA